MGDPIRTFLADRIDAGDFPSAVYLVGQKGEIVLHDALGLAVVEPERIEARKDTIYDLASLTKVLVTGLIAAQFIESSDFELDARVSRYLEDFDRDDKRAITIKDLLVHTSGMKAWLPLSFIADGPLDVLSAIAGQPLDYERGSQVLYSDLNFIAMQSVLEMVAGKTLDRIAEERIFGPLKLIDTMFGPPEELRHRIAASERGRAFERQMLVEDGFRADPGADDDVIWGEVHDGNAHFLGGVAGHAGLFSTAKEVFTIAGEFIPRSTQLLKPETCELFAADLTPDLTEKRSIAFQLASTPDSTAVASMSPSSFGHLGFTGTSLWVDPKEERVFILLTNRTHCHGLPFANINSIRRRFHEVSIDVLEQNSGERLPGSVNQTCAFPKAGSERTGKNE